MSSGGILTYEAPYPVYGLDWCKGPGTGSTSHLPRAAYRLALGSFTDDYRNRISIIGLPDEQALQDALPDDPYGMPIQEERESTGDSFVLLADALNGYPVTKVGWEPGRTFRESWKDVSTEWLAATGESLRIWEYSQQDYASTNSPYVGRRSAPSLGKLVSKIALSSSKNPNPTSAPLTSFSWNTLSPNLIVTSSIDTTCTVWDISQSSAVTQLIAHDREVYDVAWVPGSVDAFVSVGADGSLRAFDLRSLEHSTILYETPSGKKNAAVTPSTLRNGSASGGPPASLLRLSFNPYDANYLATFHTDSPDIQILDVRSPGRPVMELRAHRGAVNAVGWSKQVSGTIATASDDHQLLVWDLGSQGLYTTARSSSASATRSPRPEASATSTANSSSSSSGPRTTSSPLIAYTAPTEINNLAWSPNLNGGPYTGEDGTGAMAPRGEWIAIASGRSIKALKV